MSTGTGANFQLVPEMNSTNVCIVVPVFRASFSPEESVSLRHLARYLRSYDIHIIAPQSLIIDCELVPGSIVRFRDSYFRSVDTYSQLLLSTGFYEAFNRYHYLLIYQLDCLIFSDHLLEWCNAGLDYIGAPWFRIKNDSSSGFARVGNGGLSLRRVNSFLKVLNSQRYVQEHIPFWPEVFSVNLDDIAHLPSVQRFLDKIRVLRSLRRGIGWYAANYTLNEDHFWSDRARLFYPDFKVAPVNVALQFAFEAHPRFCFEQNNCQLPFGCHAWSKWDREFWEPFLLDEPTSARV